MTRQIQAGKASITVEANRSRLSKGLAEAQKELRSFAVGAAKIGATALGASAAFFAPMTAAVKSFADTGSALEYMSQRTNTSVESLSELEYVARAAGGSIGDIESAIQTVQGGLANNSAAFGKYGLSIAKLRGMKPDEQFATIADQISRIQDPARQAAAATELLGGSGMKLLPVLKGGGEAIEQLRAKAQRLGVGMSGEQAKAAAALGTAIDGNAISMRALTNTLSAQLAPAFTSAISVVTLAIDRAREWINANQSTVIAVAAVAAILGVLGTGLITAAGLAWGLSIAIGAVGTIASAVGTVLAAIGTILTGGIGVAIAALVIALAGLAGYLAYASGVGGKAMDWLKGKFQMLSDIAGPVFKGIQDAMSGGNFALAAEILWNGVQLAWSKGTDELWEIWDSSANSVLGVYDSVLETMSNSFDSTLSAMLNVLDNWVANFRSRWNDVSGWIADRMLESVALVDSTFDAEEAKRFRRDDTRLQNASFAAGASERAAARDTDAEQRRTDRAARTAERASEREQKATDNAIARANRIADLEAALAGSVSQAAAAAAKVEELDRSGFEGTTDGSGTSTQATTGGATSGFIAAMLGSAGGVDVQGQILSENKRQSELLGGLLETAQAKTSSSLNGISVEAVSRSVGRSPRGADPALDIIAAINGIKPNLNAIKSSVDNLSGAYS